MDKNLRFYNGLRIIIVGASPDIINNNTVMRSYVRQGFATILGDEAVYDCPLEAGTETIKRLHPDLVICFGSCMPDVANYGPMRDICSRLGVGMVFWLHDDPYEFDYGYRAAEVADWLFSNDRWSARHHTHPNVHHLPMAGCPVTHIRAWQEIKERDVFFCGVAFSNRQQLIKDLEPFLNNLRCQILGAEWPRSMKIPENRRLSSSQIVDGYASSLVTLNLGRNLHLANRRYQLDPSTPGPRTFEAALAGTVQMYFSDSLEVTDYFEVDKEILLFDGPESFVNQLEELLTDPQRAKQIAEAARTRALRDHTYANRASELLRCCGFSATEDSAKQEFHL